VTAIDLYDDYQANEVAADNKYRNKRLLVTGVVDEITKDFLDTPIVTLMTGSEFFYVSASFPKDDIKVAELSKGWQVTLECRGQGMILGTPFLDRCSVK
jgi:hypothetical protein